MRRTSLLTLGIVLGVFGTNVYRAATQSITYDEAVTWQVYAHGKFTAWLQVYEAGNHLLHSALCWLSVRLFGDHELGLRVPSLLGGLLYLVCARHLCLAIFGATGYAVLALAALALDPFLLDYFSCARGYGLGLGLVMLGLCLLLRAFTRAARAGTPGRGDGARPLAGASASLACGAAANLTVTPLAALLGACGALGVAVATRARGRALARVIAMAAGPAVLVAVLFGSPLRFASRAHFYWGVDTAQESLASLVGPSLFYRSEIWHADFGSPAAASCVAVASALVVVALLGIAVLGVSRARRWRSRASEPRAAAVDALAASVCVAEVLACLVLVVAHHVLGVRYPDGRTGLAVVPGFLLGLTLLLRALRPRWLGSLLLAGLVLRFAMQADVRSYRTWRFDASSRAVAERLVALQQEAGAPVRVAVCTVVAPSLRYYVTRWKLTERVRLVFPLAPGETYDLYVVHILGEPPQDAPFACDWELEGGGVAASSLRTIHYEPRGYVRIARRA